MTAALPYFEVAVASPLPRPLTYAASPEDAARIAPGMRLLVPLGRQRVTGWCLGPAGPPPEGVTAKKILELLDDAPLFPAAMIPFFRWVAGYYLYPLGEVIKTALPAGLTKRSDRRVTLTEAGRRQLTTSAEKEEGWRAELAARGELSPAAVRKLWQGKERRALERLAAEGLAAIEEVLTGGATRHRTEAVATPTDIAVSGRLKPSEEKTLAILRRLSGPERLAVPRRAVTAEYPGAGAAFKGLAGRGLVTLAERVVQRDPFGEPPPFFPPPDTLTGEQEAVLAELVPAIEARDYATFLLHGVTGSGKTEVYLRATAAALATGRSVLVLVPEIALATQLEAHFFSRFGGIVALQHSGLREGERFDQWTRIMASEARVVIGARSAIFAPLAAPGLIIVDEEHDGAYKQEDGLRYNGRDLAVLRGSQTGAVVLLGSATPSVVSFHHAQTGKYRLLALTRRVAERRLPAVEVVDLKAMKAEGGRAPLFSAPLLAAMGETLARGEQCLIFLNRRGFANLVLCQDCGNTVQCKNCQVTLTMHRGRQELLCHYCGYTLRANTLCAHCGGGQLVPLGFGTERLETELAEHFPAARIARMDRDTTADRREFLATLAAVRNREVDILVGTQMITKGHHFPGVTLVGIVWADAGLSFPDYKAGERTFQILSQVTGRAGRGEAPGRVIIQTFQPEHYSVETAREHDYANLFRRELRMRQALGFPPFSRLVHLCFEGDDEALVRAAAEETAAATRAMAAGPMRAEVLGPAPAPLSRLKGKHRWQLLLKAPTAEAVRTLAGRLLAAPPKSLRGNAVRMTVDVDPENML